MVEMRRRRRKLSRLFARRERDSRRGEERNELKTGINRYLNETAPRHSFCVLNRFTIKYRPTRRGRYTMCIYLYTCILFCEYGVGLPRRCATQEGPIGTQRKGKKRNERREEKKRRRRYSQSFDLNETLSASNLSLDENNCTVGGLAGG